MALQSQRFRNDAKLDGAATVDSAHIVPGASGDHVRKIQSALIDLDGANISADGKYGPATAAAVSAFKQKRNILNVQGRIDNIVGKKTMAALDSEMLAKERGVRQGIVGDSSPGEAGKPQDVIVQFTGALGSNEGAPDVQSAADWIRKINTPAYLETHKPVVPICFFGGRGANDKSADAAAAAITIRALSPNGITVVLGESSGGLPALKAAIILSRSFRLKYVGISDAAFFQTLNEVIFLQGKPTVAGFGGIDGETMDNFFQTFGHERLKKSDGPGGFMTGTEFHLPLGNGFTDHDIDQETFALVPLKAQFSLTPFADSLPVAVRKVLFADPAHVAGGRAAEAKVEDKVIDLMLP